MKKLFIVLVIAVAAIVLIGYSVHRAINVPQFTEVQAGVASGQDFGFFIISDPHYFSEELHDNKQAFQRFLSYGDKLIQYADELIDALIVDIVREKPDFLLATGDLTCNGEMQSHKELAEKFKEIEAVGTEVLVIPGNHDVLNPMARQFFENTIWETDYITRDMFADIYGDFGYREAVSRDKKSLSYLAAPSDDVWFLMLDTCIYNNNIRQNKPEPGGVISAGTIEWIKQCSELARENGVKLVAAMHHSLLDHNKLIAEDYTLQNSAEILQLFYDCDIQVVFTGHIHLQDIKSAFSGDKAIHDIATSCLTVYPNQYGVVNYRQGEGYSYQTKKIDMKQYTVDHNLKDEDLFLFDQNSTDFFVTHCCKSQNKCLSQMEGLTAEELSEVKDTVSKMNLRYFAGYRNEEMDDLTATEGYRILQTLPPCYIRDYVDNMLHDNLSDHNVFFVESF